jgi:chromosome segregation ATPase
MEKVIGLQKETHAILARLDTVEKSLRQARRDHQKQPPKLAASNIRADIAKRMENIGNIDSQIEFVKQKMERDRQESEYARERFAKMEKSITNSEQHVKNLEALLKEIPDD